MKKVTSKDGTQIAYETTGSGPAVILIGGATAVGASEGELAQLLAPDFTAFTYDRRGRAGSTDTQPFAVDREIEDIEALIDTAGGSAYLYGISSGGALALRAAAKLGGKVKKLALYEIPYDPSEEGQKAWKGYQTKLAELLAADKRGDAVALFMKFVGVPDQMLEGMRHAPFWSTMEAVAPTLAYDAEALDNRKIPTELTAHLAAPTLVMAGGRSAEHMPFMLTTAKELANTIPHAEHKILEGQTHNVDSKVLAPVLIEFFGRS